MLNGVPALITPNLLFELAKLGHGDEFSIVDANFPAYKMAENTMLKSPLQISASGLDILQAILTLMPIDIYDLEVPALRGMAVVDEPDLIPEFIQDAQKLVPEGTQIGLVQRHQFYQEAAATRFIIQSSETRPYGNLIMRKGVVSL